MCVRVWCVCLLINITYISHICKYIRTKTSFPVLNLMSIAHGHYSTDLIAFSLAWLVKYLCGSNCDINGWDNSQSAIWHQVDLKFPSQRVSNTQVWCFLCCDAEQAVEPTVASLAIWDVLTLIWRHYIGSKPATYPIFLLRAATMEVD